MRRIASDEGLPAFDSGTRCTHVVIGRLQRGLPESLVLSAEVDSGCEGVAVIQAAESRQRDNRTAARRRNRYCSTARGVLLEAKMSPVLVIVPSQMSLVQNNDVVQ